MSKVTSKLQVTIPKAIAEAHGIKPGADLVFESAGDVIRIRPTGRRPERVNKLGARIAAFDEATRRQAERDRRSRKERPELFEGVARGWRREDLYGRGIPR